jgi:2-polyprenyl-3-methyl-5-hydroxy-6-metoxy-1,4-benzoquinol methylase
MEIPFTESKSYHLESGAKSCRICGSLEGRKFPANGFEWLRCETCRTTQKVLTLRQFQDLNPTYDPGEFLDASSPEELEAFLDVRGATKVLSGIVDCYLGGARADGSKRTFLDVGCGMGMYLIAAQRLGFDVYGFEPSLNHARVATEHFRLPVVTDYFSPNRVGGMKFDLVVLSHVIEHIYEPKAFIHELIAVLKPGGVLVVITPNNESLIAHTTGKAWPMLKPIDHVSMIGAGAYDHFDLEGIAEVHHSSSEFPFEFAAAALSAARSWLASSRRDKSTNQLLPQTSAAPPLRGLSIRAKMLRYALTFVSAPMHAIAMMTGRQACLKSVLVRRIE